MQSFFRSALDITIDRGRALLLAASCCFQTHPTVATSLPFLIWMQQASRTDPPGSCRAWQSCADRYQETASSTSLARQHASLHTCSRAVLTVTATLAAKSARCHRLLRRFARSRLCRSASRGRGQRRNELGSKTLRLSLRSLGFSRLDNDELGSCVELLQPLGSGLMARTHANPILPGLLQFRYSNYSLACATLRGKLPFQCLSR